MGDGSRLNHKIAEHPIASACPIGPRMHQNQSAGDARNPLRIIELEVVARDGIEPSTRGFSVRRRARFGASKPKTGEEFSLRRPNRPGRPSLFRTGTGKSCLIFAAPKCGQRLATVATEPFPNLALNGPYVVASSGASFGRLAEAAFARVTGTGNRPCQPACNCRPTCPSAARDRPVPCRSAAS